MSAVGVGAEVLRFRDGTVFKRSKFRLEGGQPAADHPMVYRRTIKDGAWCEEWFDERIRQVCQTPATTY